MHLVEHGYDVTVVDNLSTGKVANIEHCLDQIRLVNGSILDEALVEREVDGADVVFHLAAAVGVTHIVDRPARVAAHQRPRHRERARGVLPLLARVLVASTSEVYGKSAKVPMARGRRPRARLHQGAPLVLLDRQGPRRAPRLRLRRAGPAGL